MKKQEDQKYELEDFEKHCHLWNIIVGGSGKSLVMLHKIVDAIQSENYSNPYKQRPSILLVGARNTGRDLIARAFVNSLATEDIREIPAQYLGNGTPSYQYFSESLHNTAHIITKIEQINKMGEIDLWKYVKFGECKYFNHTKQIYDLIQPRYGIIVMTASRKERVPRPLLNSSDHIVELEPYTQEQLKIIVHQLLRFSSITYEGEQILEQIVREGAGQIGLTLEFLKACITVMKAEMRGLLDMDMVEKAKRMWQIPAPPLPEDISS